MKKNIFIFLLLLVGIFLFSTNTVYADSKFIGDYKDEANKKAPDNDPVNGNKLTWIYTGDDGDGGKTIYCDGDEGHPGLRKFNSYTVPEGWKEVTKHNYPVTFDDKITHSEIVNISGSLSKKYTGELTLTKKGDLSKYPYPDEFDGWDRLEVQDYGKFDTSRPGMLDGASTDPKGKPYYYNASTLYDVGVYSGYIYNQSITIHYVDVDNPSNKIADDDYMGDMETGSHSLTPKAIAGWKIVEPAGDETVTLSDGDDKEVTFKYTKDASGDTNLLAHVLINGLEKDANVNVGDTASITGKVDNLNNITYKASWNTDDSGVTLSDEVDTSANTVKGGSRTFTSYDVGKVYKYTITATSEDGKSSTAYHTITVTDSGGTGGTGSTDKPKEKIPILAHIFGNGTEGTVQVKVGETVEVTGEVDVAVAFKEKFSSKDDSSVSLWKQEQGMPSKEPIQHNPDLYAVPIKGGTTMKYTNTGTYKYTLTATIAGVGAVLGDADYSATADLIVTVVENHPPEAEVIAPTLVYVGDIVPIKGRGTDEDEGDTEKLTYSWSITPSENVQGALDGNISKEGKENYLTFLKVDTYTPKLTVIDPGGLSDSDQQNIEVKEPIPAVNIVQTGNTKENRKIIIDASSSTPSESGLPSIYSINWTKAAWKVEAMGGGSSQDIKIQRHTEGSTNGEVLFDIDRDINNLVGFDKFDMLCKRTGKYQITAELTNTYGKTSKNTIIIDVTVDEAPVADGGTPSVVNRKTDDLDSSGYPLFTIDITDNSKSIDNDLIAKRIYYNINDSNNNKDYEDEQVYIYDKDYLLNYHLRSIGLYKDVFKKGILDTDVGSINTGNETKFEYKTNHVGDEWDIIEVIEEFGQETIPQFVTSKDRKRAYVILKIDRQNKAPEADISITGVTNLYNKNIDLNVLTDFSDASTVNSIKSKLNAFETEVGGKGVNVNVNVTDGNMGQNIFTYNPNPPLWEWDTTKAKNYSAGEYREPFLTPEIPIHLGNNFNFLGTGLDGYYTLVFDCKEAVNLTVTEYYIDDEEDKFHEVVPNNTDISASTQTHTMYFQFYVHSVDRDYSIITINGNISNTKLYKGLYSETVKGSKLPDEVFLQKDSDRYFINIINGQGNDYSKGFGNYFPLGNLTKSFVDYLNTNDYSVCSVTPQANVNYVLPESKIQEATILQMFNSNGKGNFYDTTYTSWDTQLDNVLKDIKSKYNKSTQTYNGGPILVDEQVLTFHKTYNDIEKDVSGKNSPYDEKWQYKHDPNVYKNNDGPITNNYKWTDPIKINDIWQVSEKPPITASDEEKAFNKVGKYTISYQARDNPIGFKDDSNFDEYKKFSIGEDQVSILVHRRPIAKFYYDINGSNITFINKSYDLDHCSDLNNAKGEITDGIKASNWRYKRLTDFNWISGIPSTLTPGESYIVCLEVIDIEGASSKPITQIISSKAINTIVTKVNVRYIDTKTKLDIKEPILYLSEPIGNNAYPKGIDAPALPVIYANGYKYKLIGDGIKYLEVKLQSDIQEVIFEYENITEKANVTVKYIDENNKTVNIKEPIKYFDEKLGYNEYPKGADAPVPNSIMYLGKQYILDDKSTKSIYVIPGEQEVPFIYKLQIPKQAVVMVRYIDEDNNANIGAAKCYIESTAGNITYPKEAPAPATINFAGINYSLDDSNIKTINIELGKSYDIYFKYKRLINNEKVEPSGESGGKITFNPNRTDWTNHKENGGYPVVVTIEKNKIEHTWVQSYEKVTEVESWTSTYHPAYGENSEYWDNTLSNKTTITEIIYIPFMVQYTAGNITITGGASPSEIASGGTTYVPEGKERYLNGASSYTQLKNIPIQPKENEKTYVGDNYNGARTRCTVKVGTLYSIDPPQNPVGKSEDYNIDYTNPTLSCNEASVSWYTSAIEVNIGADDLLSGVKEANYHVRDSSHYNKNYDGKYIDNYCITLEDGIYKISLDDEDRATNTFSMQSKEFKVDTIKPDVNFSVNNGIFSTSNGADGIDIINSKEDIKDFKYFGSLTIFDNLSGVNKNCMQYMWSLGKPSETGSFVYINPENIDIASHDSVNHINRNEILDGDRYDEKIIVRMEKPVGDNVYLNVKVKDIAGNYTYKSFGPFDDPIALRDFRVIDVRDRNWSEVFWKDKFNAHTGLNFPVSKLPVDNTSNPKYKNAEIKKGYAFYFDVTSEYLYREEDKIEVIPSFYYLDGSNRIEAQMYFYNQNNPFTKMDTPFTKKGVSYDDSDFRMDYKDIIKYLTSAGRQIPSDMDKNKSVSIGKYSKLSLTKAVRVVKGKEYSEWKNNYQYEEGKEQFWYGKYYIPATAIFIPKDKSKLNYSSLQPLDPKNQLNKKHIVINFQLTAYKNGRETASADQTFTYVPDRWNKEGGPKNDKYKSGDVIVYDNEHSLFDDYDTNVTY